MKEYVKPDIEIVELRTEELLATWKPSSGDVEDLSVFT